MAVILAAKHPPDVLGTAAQQRPPPPTATTIMPAVLAKSILSFARGTGAGPTQVKAEHLKIVIGEGGQQEELKSLTALANVFADGRAPKYLGPFHAGGNLIGLGKPGKDLEEDTRPICSGEIWRRAVMKALLATDRRTCQDYLEPHQLAIGTPCGVDAYVHLTRRWFDSNADSDDKVLLKKDKVNAFNIVNRHKMLLACQEYLPGAARFAEWCYGQPSNPLWGETLMHSEVGCQQGCPLAMALYCCVDQQLREHTGIVQATTPGVAAPLPEPVRLELSISFADDSNDGGTASEVQRSLEAELRVAGSLGLECKFSEMQVSPCAGHGCTADLSWCIRQGIAINYTQCVEIAKAPIGTTEFAAACVEKRMAKICLLMAELSELPDKHAAIAIHRSSCNGSRMAYLSRTTPGDLIAPQLREFDTLKKATFEAITAVAVNDRQWRQAALSSSKAGLGMRSLYDHADASYVASRAQTHDTYVAAVSGHAWEAADADSQLAKAIGRLNADHGAAIPLDRPQPVRQQTLSSRIDAGAYRQLLESSTDEYERAHLKAQEAAGAEWLLAIPSDGLDTHLSNRDLTFAVKDQLGVDVFTRMSRCLFCGVTQDTKGAHCKGCMKTLCTTGSNPPSSYTI